MTPAEELAELRKQVLAVGCNIGSDPVAGAPVWVVNERAEKAERLYGQLLAAVLACGKETEIKVFEASELLAAVGHRSNDA